ncbi:MAG: lysophospholipid acyltransferase [Vezdaea aestivalis]|nr:MAG: lysophospholipid acyltransferase [Vezdaea aestivalis]
MSAIKLIGVFLISYPLTALLKRLPDNRPDLKNLFSIFTSLFFLLGLFSLWDGVFTLLVASTVTYALALYVHHPLMPWLGFTFLMLHMSIGHINRQFFAAADTFDITGAQMVLVMKLSAFCWNVRDGRTPEAELADVQKERALKTLPSLLDYAGYVLFFPALFAGPAFDYIDYKNWLSTEMFSAPPNTPKELLPPTRKKRRIPRSGTPAMIKLVTGLTWLGLFMYFSARYNPKAILSPAFTSQSLPRRLLSLHLLGLTTRLKYYAVWTLTEGACILSGLGLSPTVTPTTPPTYSYTWNRLQNISPLALETARNTRGYLDAWNMGTNRWLRNYVYLRVTPRGQKPGFRASLATFATSAFWHGFYPGYYLAFILAAFLQTLAKMVRRQVRPLFVPPVTKPNASAKILYDVLSWLATQLAFSFAVSAFILLKLEDVLFVWRAVWFYAPLGTGIGLAVLGNKKVKKWLKKRSEAGDRPGVKRSASVESMGGGAMGVPSDPSWVADEVVREARERVEMEMETRRRKAKGSEVKGAS